MDKICDICQESFAPGEKLCRHLNPSLSPRASTQAKDKVSDGFTKRQSIRNLKREKSRRDQLIRKYCRDAKKLIDELLNSLAPGD